MKTIGLTGLATCGKDTFFNILKDGLPNKKVQRFALADHLKREMAEFISEKFGIDVWNCSGEQKQLIRPLLVAHGKVRRSQSNGTYWTGYLSNWMSNSNCDIAVVTDIRYAQYDADELYWLKEIMKGTLVHIKRDGIKPPNEDEKINDPIMEENADYKIFWESHIGKPQVEAINRHKVLNFIKEFKFEN